MKIYNIYAKKNEDFKLEDSIFIEEGFSWFAGIFKFLWFLYHRMWMAALFAFAVYLILESLHKAKFISEMLCESFAIFFMIVIASFAKDWQEIYLLSKNYELKDVICAANLEKAKFELFQRHCDNSKSNSLPLE